MSVVHCNYAVHYDGTITWQVKLDGPKYHYLETGGLTFLKGLGFCSGSVTITDQGVTTTGTIGGSGLVAVEFDENAQVGKYYVVTAACPSVAGMGSPVTPPQLDGREHQSYPQPSTLTPGNPLKGSTTSHPDDDPVNGASSTVIVTWDLTKAKP
jgi:hypothetical protein